MPNESTSLLQTNFVHEAEPIITIKDTNFTYSTAKTASTNLDASNNPTPVIEEVGNLVIKDSTNATMLSISTQYMSLSGTDKELVLFVSPKGNTSNSINMHFKEDGTKYINVNNATISNVKSPSGNTDAATKGYVDDTVDAHANNTKHVSDTERNTWNGKQNTTLGTANRVVVTNGSNIISTSSITTTELGYLDGVTSNVQTQLTAKEASGTAATAVSTHNGSTAAHANGFNHALPMNNNKITGLATPTASTDAATKGYVDGAGLKIVSGTYTCTGDQNNTVIYVKHGRTVAPKMVFACMSGHTSGGDMSMATGTVTMFVFATIPMTNGALSTTQISFLVPDVTTSTSTKIMWTALFDK